MRWKQDISNVKVNPLRIACSAFLLVSPFLAWLTISAFGIFVSSSLWDIANSRTSFPVSSNITTSSLIATLLLIAGGLINLRNWKLGLPIATGGLAAFLLEGYSLYGAKSSVIVIEALPRIGLFIAPVGIVLGVLSTRITREALGFLAKRLTTGQGLFTLGLSIASVSLLLDALGHTGLGESSAFFGIGPFEETLHAGLFFSLATVLGISYMGNALEADAVISGLVIATFLFLVFDASYHIVTGGLTNFIGHGSVETILHISSYYGVAFMLVGRILLKR